MKKFITALTFVLFLSSCGIKHTPAVNMIDLGKLDLEKDLAMNKKKCAYGPLWFPSVAGSSSSAIEVAKKSGFVKISAIDYQSDFFLLFNRTCTIVYGSK